MDAIQPKKSMSNVLSQDTPEHNSNKLKSTINALVWAGLGAVIGGSGAVIAISGPNAYKTIKDEYIAMMDLRARKSELLQAEQILNELKKYPGANINFDSKTNKWSIVLPPKTKIKAGKISTTQGKSKIIKAPKMAGTRDEMSVEQNTYNPRGIFGNDELQTITISSTYEHTGIITTEDNYSAFVRTLNTNVSMAMPDFMTLKDTIGLKVGEEIKLIERNDEVWVYGKIQENDSSQKYRLRIAVIDTNNKKINASFLNRFNYLIEN